MLMFKHTRDLKENNAAALQFGVSKGCAHQLVDFKILKIVMTPPQPFPACVCSPSHSMAT